MKAEVVFGVAGQGCKGSGICMVFPATMSSSMECWPCPHATCLIGWHDGRLRFQFLRAGLDPRQIRRYFRWGLFEVAEPYALPRFLRRQLKIAQPYTIAAGVYRADDVCANSEYITICF